MKYGIRRHGSASLTLRKPQALPKHMRGPIVELHDLYTLPECREQGDASMLMLQTTLEADLAAVMLFLAVLPSDTTDPTRLVSFYGRNGFLPLQNDPPLMIRPHVGMTAGRG